MTSVLLAQAVSTAKKRPVFFFVIKVTFTKSFSPIPFAVRANFSFSVIYTTP